MARIPLSADTTGDQLSRRETNLISLAVIHQRQQVGHFDDDLPDCHANKSQREKTHFVMTLQNAAACNSVRTIYSCYVAC